MVWEVKTLGDFLRRIAFDYARFGYTRFALREVPKDKDLAVVDRKIRCTYNLTTCRTKRMRLKRQGKARVQYLRFKHSFVLLATEGTHIEFERLRSYDMRNSPLHFRGYSIGFRGLIVSVRVAQQVWNRVERQVGTLTFEKTSVLENAITTLPYYHFPDVIHQKQRLLNQINKCRKQAGLKPAKLLLPQTKTHWRCSCDLNPNILKG
ncbi:MAG: hypothetical protein AAF959_09985 [Cyanobacteria bacterium P01_D01_bin.56]